MPVLLGRAYAFEGTLELENLTLNVSENPSYQELDLYGNFSHGDSKRIDDFLKDLKPDKDIHLNLNFGGGWMGPTSRFAEILKEKCSPSRNHCQITTVVHSRQSCASLCIVLFMLGSERIAEPYSRFGFHSAATILHIRVPGIMQSTYRKIGVSDIWLKANLDLFSILDTTWRYPEIVDSNIITKIVNLDGIQIWPEEKSD